MDKWHHGGDSAIWEIQKRKELDKAGTLIKDNLKGAIHRGAENEKLESSDKERKMRGRGTREKQQYAPTGPERSYANQEWCNFEKKI